MTVTAPDPSAGYTDVTFRWYSEVPVVVSLHLTGYPGTTIHGGIGLTLTEPGVYATTVRLPDDACVSYGFLVFESVEAQQEFSIYQVLDNLVSDPANPDVIRRPFGMRGWSSVLELPGARTHPAWPDPDQDATSEGESSYAIVESGRTLTILPGDADGPLLVMFDGDLWADADFGYRSAMTQRNKDATGPSPTTILVSTPDRQILDNRELMTHLLTREILPALERAGIRGKGLIVAGQSYGGLAAAGLVIDHPDLIDAAIVQSGSFWFDDESETRDYSRPGTLTRSLQRLAGTGTFATRIVVQVGSIEGAMVDQSKWFADAATAAGARVHFETYSGGHDYAWYRHGILYAIDRLCAPRVPPVTEPEA